MQVIEREIKYRRNGAYRFAVAPMMDWTDRHCRYFHRLMTRRALLYTEMLTTGAVLHGDRTRLLRFDPSEHPVAVQLGGCDPAALAEAARICADFGYDEVNLNVGCPSDRVRNGRFGACLMAEPALVGECVAAMKAAVAVSSGNDRASAEKSGCSRWAVCRSYFWSNYCLAGNRAYDFISTSFYLE